MTCSVSGKQCVCRRLLHIQMRLMVFSRAASCLKLILINVLASTNSILHKSTKFHVRQNIKAFMRNFFSLKMHLAKLWCHRSSSSQSVESLLRLRTWTARQPTAFPVSTCLSSVNNSLDFMYGDSGQYYHQFFRALALYR